MTSTYMQSSKNSKNFLSGSVFDTRLLVRKKYDVRQRFQMLTLVLMQINMWVVQNDVLVVRECLSLLACLVIYHTLRVQSFGHYLLK